MTRLSRTRQDDERGVVLIIIALAMVVLIGMMSIAIDGSYGFVQDRRAQNASDFAAFAAAQRLNSSFYCNGTGAPTTPQIVQIVSLVVGKNDPGLGNAWTGEFLDKSGKVINDASGNPITFATGSTGLPPSGSCGVNIVATPKWPPFFAGIFGKTQLGGRATASVAPKSTQTNSIGIVALNKVGPHEILAGGTGVFVVSGSIFLNTDVLHQPWSGSFKDPTSGVTWTWNDAIDAKSSSNLYVYGTIHSNNGTANGQPEWPLDNCFQPNIEGFGNPPPPTSPLYQPGDPATGVPGVQMNCQEHGGSVNVDFNNIDPTNIQIDDPLQSTGAPPNPLNPLTNIACPGSTLQTPTLPLPVDANGVTQLTPGEYTMPVEITGSANFQDCPGGYTGIYRFDHGLWINPQGATDKVTGNDVVIATQNPYPMAGNVPDVGGVFGTGNGAPCLPSTTITSGPSGNGTPMAETSGNVCSGTTPPTNGVIGYGDSTFVPDAAETGTGNNFSVIIGGVPGSSVNLTGPVNSAYGGTDGNPGLVLYQDPNTQANYGFDAEAGDGAAIAIDGVVYNASLSGYGANAPLDYWDGTGGGIPFYAGGTLQAGFGAGWSPGPAQSTGSVTLTGTAIVDDFNTDGGTQITILGKPYSLPGDSTLSLIG